MKKILTFGIVILLIGMSVIPATTSFPLKESFNPTENDATYQKSQFNPRDMDYNEHLMRDHVRYYDSRFFSKERISQYPGEPFGYEEAGSFYQNIISTDMSNNGNYTPHAPIEIYGDDDFTEKNGVVGGNGTADDPYIIEGWEINGDSYGIGIYGTTSHFIIRDCLLTAYYAINFNDVTFGTVSSLTAYDSTFGINIRDCSENIIMDCDLFSSHYGIMSWRSENLILRNNSMYSNDYNLGIEGTITEHYHHDIDTSNTVNGKPVYYIYNESDLVFSGIEDIGLIGLIKCKRISVEGIMVDGNNRHGILLVETTDSSIASSTFSNNVFGLGLFGCLNNTIADCRIVGENALYGIDLSGGSSKNNILGCEVKGGILLENAPFNVLRNNTITGDYINFQVFGNKISDFVQDIDESNTINGKPIYYFVGENNLNIYGSNIGYLGFVNCTNVKVHDIATQYLAQGLLLVNTKAVVKRCMFWACSWGVHLFKCSDVKIYRCSFKYNFCGPYLDHSSGNQIFMCDVSDNWWLGFFLENSDDNVIKRCKVYNTGMDGFDFRDSYDNAVHYNNIDGSGQSGLAAIDSSVDATNNWWGSYYGPSGAGPGNGDSIVLINANVTFKPWLKDPALVFVRFLDTFLMILQQLIERFPILGWIFSSLI